MSSTPVSWVTADDVAESLAVGAVDAAWLQRCTDAANAWAFRKRDESGYVDDPANVPGDDVALGTILVAQALYRERGGLMDASYAELASAPNLVMADLGMSGQVNRLLAISRPTVA